MKTAAMDKTVSASVDAAALKEDGNRCSRAISADSDTDLSSDFREYSGCKAAQIMVVGFIFLFLIFISDTKCLCVMIDCNDFAVECFHAVPHIPDISERENPDKENTNQNTADSAKYRRHHDSP